ncbi:MAG: hypothetical protein JSU85_05435 [Candidatus Zixiibacteriota bacterium]|nr:MAG: hypothetical protein JSU85_05435 [candidate division Zixibacteria bacterium]
MVADNKDRYTSIVGRLKSLEGRLAYLDSIKGVVLTIGIALICFGILIGITVFGWPGRTARLVIDLAILTFVTISLYFAVFKPLIKRSGLLSVARSLEKHYGKFQSRLIGALELYDHARHNRENYSIELIEKTIEEAGGVISEIDADVIIDKKPLISTSIKTAVIAAAAVIGFFLNPSIIRQSWTLYAHPLTEYVKPPEFRLAITPDGGEFFRNRDLLITAKAEGKIPRNVDLYFQFEDGEWAYEPMEKSDSLGISSFVYNFKKIKRSLDLYARSGNVESQRIHIDIVDPPRLVDIFVKIDYPEYSGLPDAAGNPNDGNIAALKGSKAILTGLANKPLKNSYLLFSDSSKIKLDIKGKNLSGRIDILKNDRYTIAMIDSSERVNPEPIWYDIQILEDYPPSIEIIYPADNVDLSEDMILPIDVFITDDFGFGRLNLVWWIVSEGRQGEPVKLDLQLRDRNELEKLVRYPWNTQDISPMPGDLIYYYCEVSDNDVISGPKWSKSKTFIARLPSLDEILAEVQGSQEQQIEDIEEVMRDQRELQEKLNEIAREMLKATEIKWEAQQEAKGALEKQRDIAESLEKLADEMQKNLDRLEENRLIGEEIAEKLNELNRLMEEIATPELKEAMKKLEEALKNMDPEEMKKALEEFQMTAEELLENLERSLSLMKQLAVEQKMDLLAELAQKILEDQIEINENVSVCNDSSGLADLESPQQANQNQFNSLKEQFEQLKQMDQDTQIVPEDSKADAEKQLNNPEIPEDFNGMKSSMCRGSMGNCQSKGKRLERNLSELADAMRKARDSMQQQMKARIARKMQKAAEDLLYLSNRQESLLDSTRAYDRTREMVRGFAGQQSQIESAALRSAELLSEISNETVFISMPLLRLMGQILEDLAEASLNLDKSQANSAVRSEISAMSNMNMLVMLLMQAKNNACSSNSGSGMKEMMEKLAQCTKGQQGINNQTLMQMPKPGMSLNLSQQQALRRLAAQQEALRQQMKGLQEEFGKRGDMLGRFDALGEEMKKVAEDLQDTRVDRRTIERQERILSRLLDAQKSVNRREYSRKRKAETGSEHIRRSPEFPANMTEENERLLDIIKKTLQEKYPRKYERLIKAYFRSLQNNGAALE